MEDIAEYKTNIRHSRFRGIPFFNRASEATVFIAGVGGIGSWVNLLLSRIVKQIYVIDDDTFETINMAGQLVSNNQVGNSKVRVAATIAKEYGTAKITPLKEKLVEGTEVSENYVFSCFDNMEARKILFETWKMNPERELFIDARLLGEQYEVFFVQKGQEEAYEAELFDDDEAPEVDCTIKQTSHFAAMCAGTMVWGFTNYLSSHMFYKLPFHIQASGPLFNFEIRENDIQ